MAVELYDGFEDASTFHFREPDGGGHHWSETEHEAAPGLNFARRPHLRHDGFLNISFEQYRKGSPHPFIHQLNRRMIKSLSDSMEDAIPSNNLEFLSRQIVHRIKKNMAHHTFLKKLPCRIWENPVKVPNR